MNPRFWIDKKRKKTYNVTIKCKEQEEYLVIMNRDKVVGGNFA